MENLSVISGDISTSTCPTKCVKTELSNVVSSILNVIDSLPLHPKNKLLLYNRYLLPNISWHFTVCDLSKTWICQNLNNTEAHYIRKWLELPISSTLSNILPHESFALVSFFHQPNLKENVII